MLSKITTLKRNILILFALQAVGLFALAMFFKVSVWLAVFILVVEGFLTLYLFDRFDDAMDIQSSGVKEALGAGAREAFLVGGVGMVIYDDQYVVTWMSELFAERHINRVGERILTWLPEVDDIIQGNSEEITVQLDEHVYKVRRKTDAHLLVFRDVTELTLYREKYEEEKVVIGLASLDNYEESIQYADETVAANINANIRSPLTDYCSLHQIFIKRLNNSRYLLLLNEDSFERLMQDRFSVLTKVRKAAQKEDLAITLSLAFAKGSGDFNVLDDMASALMELAQTRGGDQVAVQEYGKEVKYYGGSTEAAEKRSRVRVRVMAHSLRDLFLNCGNVIIAGHKNADFDCIGSALALAKTAQAFHKPVCIIAKTGGIEEKLDAVLKDNKDELSEEVNFVTESEALNQLRDNTLVIMTDHHNVKQSNGSKVEELANKVVIIDHHRRSTEIGVRPVLVYIEAGASSACELVTEMIPYITSNVDITELDATIMLTGMTIDTDRWHVRTGARTYEAAAQLRQYGADPQRANEFLKDTYDEFNTKSRIMAGVETFGSGVVIAPYAEKSITRTLMSQTADALLGIMGVNAAFVIANDSDGQTCISARSGGRINVQAIMEKMNGGGHMTAAAVQRSRTSVGAMKIELIAAIEEYEKEEADTDESNS